MIEGRIPTDLQEQLRLLLSEREFARIMAEPTPHNSGRELYRDACAMKRAGISAADQVRVLEARFAGYYKSKHREIACAVENADDSTSRPPRFPKPNAEVIRKVTANAAGALDRLRAISPTKNPGTLATGAIIDRLFKPDDLLCFGSADHGATTDSRTFFRGDEGHYPFIVPSPMSAPMGTTQAGRPSPRTLSNVGPRAYAVIEFDTGTLDEQAEIILHLQQIGPPLQLVLFSGSKSLHAWFEVRFLGHDETEKFLRYAAYLGADTATFNPVQFVRTPNAWRDAERKQTVEYLK